MQKAKQMKNLRRHEKILTYMGRKGRHNRRYLVCTLKDGPETKSDGQLITAQWARRQTENRSGNS